jgi:hypothetical protein
MTKTQNHPLRLCAMRLKAKAEYLLKYITDRKERADPPVPIDLSVPSSGRRAPSHPLNRLNGINGYAHALSFLPSRPPSSNDSRTGRRLTPTLTPSRRPRGQAFLESPAIVRTAEGMAAILELEQSLDAVLSAPGPSSNAEALDVLLRSYMGESDSDADGETESDDEEIAVDGATGEKRKLFVFTCQRKVVHSTLTILFTEMVSPTLASVSAPAFPRPAHHTPLNFGGVHNHLIPLSPTLFRLFLLSLPLDLRHHPPRLDHKTTPPVRQQPRGAKSAGQSLPHPGHARC